MKSNISKYSVEFTSSERVYLTCELDRLFFSPESENVLNTVGHEETKILPNEVQI
jgi:hypothetical protein